MLITNGNVLTFGREKQVIPGGAVYYEGDTIKAVGPTSLLTAQYPQAQTLDAQGRLIMPGNICGHTHFYSAFSRGMAVPGAPPKILCRFWKNCGGSLIWLKRWKDAGPARNFLIDATRTPPDRSPRQRRHGQLAGCAAEASIRLRASLYEVTIATAKRVCGPAENNWLKNCGPCQSGEPRRTVERDLWLRFAHLVWPREQALQAPAGLETGFHIHLAEDKGGSQVLPPALQFARSRRLERSR